MSLTCSCVYITGTSLRLYGTVYVQVWDLTAGKLLHEFRHEDAITAVEYHPSEFILATSSADRTVKWWDLETSELIDSAGPETTGGTLLYNNNI